MEEGAGRGMTSFFRTDRRNGSVHYASTPTLFINHHNAQSDGEDNHSSSSSSSPYSDPLTQRFHGEGESSPYYTRFYPSSVSSSNLYDNRPDSRLLGIAEESEEDPQQPASETLSVTERDIFAIKSSLKGYRTHAYVSSTLANLYFSPRSSTKTDSIRPDRWNLTYTGIPVLLLDAGDTKSRRVRRIQIFLVEKGSCFSLWSDVIDNLSRYSCDESFHTLYYSKDHSLRVGLSFDNPQEAKEFYSRVCALTENPINIALSGPSSKKTLSYNNLNTRHYFNENDKKDRKKPDKTQISTPCGFQHIVSVQREDIDKYFSLQSYVGKASSEVDDDLTYSTSSLQTQHSSRNNQNRKKRPAPQLPRTLSVPEVTKL